MAIDLTNIQLHKSPPNPCCRDGKWFWHDESYSESKPYDTEAEARKDLDAYVRYLETGETE
jgi:hypothetical protein